MKKNMNSRIVLPLFFVSSLVVLLISLFSSSLMSSTNKMLEYNTEQRLLAVSRAAAQLVTAEELDQFQTEADMAKPEYEALRDRLIAFSKDYNVLYVYYMRRVEPECGLLQHIVDNDLDPEWQVGLHTAPVPYEEAPLLALAGQPASSGVGGYSDNWEGLLPAYAPVYNSDGQVVAIAGVDISDEQIVYTRRNLTLLNVLQIISLVAVVVSGLLGFRLYRAKAAQSESASVAKSQFLSRMSHEIRTPLNAVIGLSRMAKESSDLGQVHHYLDNITTASGHLLRLINDVLDLSKIEVGKMAMDITAMDTRAELDNIRSIVCPQIEAKKQTFTMRVDPDVPKCVYCDHTQVKQIVMNVLSNAVKFTPDEGEISLDVGTIGMQGDKCGLQFVIKDNGIGIEEEYLPTLFSPFEQGDGGTTRKFGGTGLGLSIAYQLVEMMEGTIQVNSAVGRGSEFIVTIWLTKAPDDAVTSAESRLRQQIDLTDKCVLLVEDSDINRMIAEDVFVGMGARVDTAENGLIGLQRYLNHPEKYAMIFMDVQMPIMDGYEATRKIRESKTPNARTIPIIAMTANVFREDVDKAFDAGMNAHVGKPFEVEQVEAAILSVLG